MWLQTINLTERLREAQVRQAQTDRELKQLRDHSLGELKADADTIQLLQVLWNNNIKRLTISV